MSDATDFLREAIEAIGDRAKERDTASERSMLRCVRAFNALLGTDLSETDGWLFMAILKAARAQAGEYRRDDYVDGAAYFALAGESAERAAGARIADLVGMSTEQFRELVKAE